MSKLIENNLLNKIIFVIVILFISFNIVTRFLVMQGIIDVYYMPNILAIFIPFLLIIYGSLIIFGKVRFDITDIIVGLLIVVGIIATIYAFNIRDSIWGHPDRGEGLVSLCVYYLFYLVCKNLDNKYKLKIIYFILFASLVAVTYSFLQLSELSFVNQNGLFISGLFGNANFSSSYMLMMLSLSAGLYLYTNNYKLLHIAFILIYSFTLFLCNSTSGLVGLAVVIIIMFLSKMYKKVIKILACILITFSTYTIFIESELLLSSLNLISDSATSVSNLEISDNIGTNRGFIYKETFVRVPEHLLNGIGIDNFSYLKDGLSIKYEGTSYDKAHSEPLQILITQGIFALILYLSLYGYSVVKYIKTKKTIENKIIFLLITGYLVQGLFNISVISVAPIFFIFLGLLNSNKEGFKLWEKTNLK